VAAINAGYFDPANQLTTSAVWVDGKLMANPQENPRLMENPGLKPYLPALLNRSELRILDCEGHHRRFQIAPAQSPLPQHCLRRHSLQAGPDLMHSDAALQEAFIAYKKGRRIRDPIGVDAYNARSAVGIDEQGNLLLVTAQMKPKGYPAGVTLTELAQTMRALGAVQAMALDGGSSTSFWQNGQTFFGKLDKDMNPVKRPIKSALVVTRQEDPPHD
jgi:hypothetical protein